MCIIAYKSIEAQFPSKKTLKRCFDGNPDGAGFMFNASGVVHIEKGFMSFQHFWKALRRAREQYGDNNAYVMHFRISTQAHDRADCTHPFPLSRQMKDMRLLSATTDIGVAHNGIISYASDKWSKTITYSDTMKFITDYLSLIIKSKAWYRDKDKVQLIENLITGSRLAILDGTGHCELMGNGWIEENGIWYSNSSFRPQTKKASTWYEYTSWWDSYIKEDDKKDDKKNVKTDTYSYEDDPYYWDYIEDSYNPSTDAYHLDPLDCPATIYNELSFCRLCENYDECYKVEEVFVS